MTRKFAIVRFHNNWRYQVREFICDNWEDREIKSLIKPLCYIKFRIWFFIWCRDDEYTLIKDQRNQFNCNEKTTVMRKNCNNCRYVDKKIFKWSIYCSPKNKFVGNYPRLNAIICNHFKKMDGSEKL